MRYVVDAKKPFLVDCNHGGDWFRGQGLDEPMPTLTASRDAFGLVMPAVAPVVSHAQQGGGNRSAETPLHTLTASAKDQNCVVAPTLVQTGYGERKGQAPRVPGLDKPIGVQVAGGAKHALVSAFLAQHNNDSRRIGGVNPGRACDVPLATLTASGSQQQVVAAHMLSMRGSDRRDYPADMPARTDSAGGNHEAVAAAFLSRQFGNSVGSDAGDPVGTITAGGAGKAAIVAAFLHTYYGCSETHSLSEPMGTDTTLDRRSLVTVEIDGQSYAIVDIGMRMLTPRERFRAQGFPDSYRIETGIGEDDQEVALSQSAQGRMCGNSVCPDIAEALAGANVPDLVVREVAA
jgi:DNA (cytosine-5)-methyltransferase 1